MRGAAGTLIRLIVVGLLLATPAILAWGGLDELVPEAILTQVRRNNEAFVFAGLAITAASFRRPASRRLLTVWWVLLAAAFILTEVTGASLGFPQWVITLNEAILGAGVLTIGIHHLGSGSGRAMFYGSLLVVILLGEVPLPGWHGSSAALWIVDHAEAWGFALLASIHFDFIRPLTGRPPAPLPAQVAWYVALLVVPPVLSALNQNGVDSAAAVGPVESALVWVQRITEAFIAALVISIYYAAVAAAGQRRRPPA